MIQHHIAEAGDSTCLWKFTVAEAAVSTKVRMSQRMSVFVCKSEQAEARGMLLLRNKPIIEGEAAGAEVVRVT